MRASDLDISTRRSSAQVERLEARLGSIVRTVEKDWEKARRRPDVFPKIAAKTVKCILEEGYIDPDTVIAWVMQSRAMPRQFRCDENFGQPPVTLAQGDGFHLDLLFWRRAGTAIHSHAFYGAFGVLVGPSVHAEYDFQTEQCLTPFVSVVHAKRTNLEALANGTVREIHADPQRMHSLVHLGHPSASLVLRTSQPAVCSEWAAVSDTLAIRPAMDEVVTRKRQILGMLLRTDRRECWEHLREVCRSGDVTAAVAFAIHEYPSAVPPLRSVILDGLSSLPEGTLSVVKQGLEQLCVRQALDRYLAVHPQLSARAAAAYLAGGEGLEEILDGMAPFINQDDACRLLADVVVDLLDSLPSSRPPYPAIEELIRHNAEKRHALDDSIHCELNQLRRTPMVKKLFSHQIGATYER